MTAPKKSPLERGPSAVALAKADGAQRRGVLPGRPSQSAMSATSHPSNPSDSVIFLLQHFNRLAEAPGGIAKLRALVLQLAVHGKLGTQNPKDEPLENTGRYFQKIAEKESIPTDEQFLDRTPANWRWIRFEWLGEIFGGHTPSMNRGDFWDGTIPWVSPKDMHVDQIEGTEMHVTEKAVAETRLKLVPPGSLFFVTRSGILKRKLPVVVNAVPCTVNQDLKVLTPQNTELTQFIRLLLRGHEQMILKELVKTGTTVQSLKFDEFRNKAFPFPPLAEQQRIVAKVEELMGLCDALEAAQREREAVRTRLRTSALHQLASPNSDSNSAAFVLQNLPQFTSAPEDLAQLRQTVLQFAVTGRLSRNLSGWRECKLGEILIYGPKNGVSPKASSVPTKTKSLSLSATTSGIFKGEYFKYVDLEPEKESELWLCDGDILIQRSNTREYVGTAAIYRGAPNSFIYPDLMMRIRVADTVDVDYIYRVLSAPATRAYFSGAASGSSETMPKLNQEAVRNTPIPLPPLAEQRRIVAKVDELMAVLDALEATLTTARTTAEKLLAATVAKLHAA